MKASDDKMKQGYLLVSIVVPMHNTEKFISDTLVSLLRETQIPLEVVVVDDKSTERSLERVLGFNDNRLRVIEGPGSGAAGAMNAGYGAARGSIIMCCDSDDL